MCKTPSIFGAGQPPDHSIAKARMLNVRYSLRALRQIRFAHLPQRPHLRCDFARPERKEECEKYTKIIFTTPSPQMLWLRQVRKERGVRKCAQRIFALLFPFWRAPQARGSVILTGS